MEGVEIPDKLTLRVEQDGRKAVLSPTGELDLASGEKLTDRLRAVEAEKPPLIVLDLQGLRFMDSSGLALVIRAHTRARNEGRRFVIVPGPPQVQRVFTITGLDTVLDFDDGPLPDTFDRGRQEHAS